MNLQASITVTKHPDIQASYKHTKRAVERAPTSRYLSDLQSKRASRRASTNMETSSSKANPHFQASIEAMKRPIKECQARSITGGRLSKQESSEQPNLIQFCKLLVSISSEQASERLAASMQAPNCSSSYGSSEDRSEQQHQIAAQNI